MVRRCVLVILLLSFCVAFVQCGKYDNVTKLQVGIKHRPENCDRKVKEGDTIKVHYTGTLTNGEQFDSSIPRGQPFQFTVGRGMVIKGWDSGLLGACVGEKRKLGMFHTVLCVFVRPKTILIFSFEIVIPPSLGYGERGAPPKIPGNSVLIFDVEVVEIA
jgi:FK506-binding protein 2